VFTSLGFQDVATYKQSGNVIFEAEDGNQNLVRTKIEGKLRHALGYEVAVVLRTIPQLKAIVGRNSRPAKEGNSVLVTLLPGPVERHPLVLPLTLPKSGAEIYSFSGSEFFSLTHGGGEGALPNPFLESKLKVKATTRNMNVLRGIVEKFGQAPRKPLKT